MDYKTIKEIVAIKLREELLSGVLVPGQELTIKTLSERFTCSVTPIREAINILESEGLVSVNRHKSLRVINFDVNEIEKMFEIRGLLEGYASSLAVQNIDKGLLEILKKNLRDQAICNKKRDFTNWIKLNRNFHDEIYKCTKQPVLLELITLLRNRTFHYVKTYTVLLDRSETATLEHNKIYNAILEKDRTKTRELTEKHLDNLAKSLINYLKVKRNFD